jgi:hypothetical protein
MGIDTTCVLISVGNVFGSAFGGAGRITAADEIDWRGMA